MKWGLDKSKLAVRPMPAAPNQWEVYDKDTGKGIIGYTEKGMCYAFIECDGDISF